MNTFEKIKSYFQSFEIGSEITRQQLMKKKLGWQITIDNYRNHFTNAGYLKWLYAGHYQLIKEIPDNLNSRDLRKEAYPHYKNWYEYKHLNKKIPEKIQSEYSILMSRLMDGSADPDCVEVEDRVEKLRKEYPNI